MRWHFGILFVFIILGASAMATPLQIEAINKIQLHMLLTPKERIDPIFIKAQVLLDRAHFSPGEIDGKFGDNASKTLKAFAVAHGLSSSGELTDEVWQELTAVFVNVTDPVGAGYVASLAREVCRPPSGASRTDAILAS
jgi:hypothetical protein